jgi:hypothetical protein
MVASTKPRSKPKAKSVASPARRAPAKPASATRTPARPASSSPSRSGSRIAGKSGKPASRQHHSSGSVLPSAATLASAESLLSGLANYAPSRLTSQVKQMAEQVMDWAGTAAEMAVGATAPLVKEPKRRAALERAGLVIRDARETAGLTAQDVSAALDFSDTNLLDLAESGRIALPFEVILRLASLLARNDPIAFVMNLTRFYNPGLWKLMEQLGIGKLALNVGREREFMNIFRSNDSVRQLKDDELKIVLKFTQSAFDSAVEMAMLTHAKRVPAKPKAE